MIKFFLYLTLLTGFIPLVSAAKINPGVQIPHPELRGLLERPFFNGYIGPDDSIRVIMASIPFQDTTRSGIRKRIKEVPRPKPQSRPEKIAKRPAGRPEDQGNAARKPARPATRPGGGQGGVRPAGGQDGMRPTGGKAGARPQAPPPKRGR